jgi:hypothetical protein
VGAQLVVLPQLAAAAALEVLLIACLIYVYVHVLVVRTYGKVPVDGVILQTDQVLHLVTILPVQMQITVQLTLTVAVVWELAAQLMPVAIKPCTAVHSSAVAAGYNAETSLVAVA